VRILPILTAVPLLLSFGVVEGVWSNRWGFSRDAELAAARLRDVPMTVGEWEAQARELDDRQIARAELTGYLLRQYVHRRTGASLQVLLVCGRPGPISVHTPEVCYGGAGFAQAATRSRQLVEDDSLDKSVELWMAKFRKIGAPVPEQLRIFWSFAATGAWTAPGNPRLAFAREGALYKLYVVRQMPNLDEPLAKDPSLEFLRLFMPEVNKCLFKDSD
jgi:hypothetical protein